MRDLLQPMHLVIIALVFMVLFGGKKLAEWAKDWEKESAISTSLKGDEPPPPRRPLKKRNKPDIKKPAHQKTPQAFSPRGFLSARVQPG